jgi:hypothetical protein
MVLGTRFTVVVSLILLLGCAETPPDPRADGSPSLEERADRFQDAEVARIWTRMMETIAPDDGWEQARYLEFHWAVARDDGDPLVRQHRWDRWDGQARVESPTDDGPMIALFQTDAPEDGRVWIGGEELTGEEARERLSSAHRAHINDAYWLLMPYKWEDPGVNLRYAGHETDSEGIEWEVVELTFQDETGLTPQNMYRAFINPETGRMERWHFLSNPDADPSPSDWTDWEQVGPIHLAVNRRVDGEPWIFFPHLRVETEVPEGVFDPPSS